MISIGYEGRDLDGFLKALKDHHVEVLVDVRLNPISRKRGFSKRALSEVLAVNGIEYVHTPQLGNPKENRAGFSGPGLEAARRKYMAHLNNGSRRVYEDVVERARNERIALLCVERDDRYCHRGCIIAQAKVDRPALKVHRL
jgi:uncharacterized protein (DUF488 family)